MTCPKCKGFGMLPVIGDEIPGKTTAKGVSIREIRWEKCECVEFKEESNETLDCTPTDWPETVACVAFVVAVFGFAAFVAYLLSGR